MRKKFLIFAAFLSSFLGALYGSEDGKVEESGGRTYTAKDIKYVYIDNDTIQAEFVLPCTFDRLWSVITDYENSHKVMPNVKKTVVLSSEEKNGEKIDLVETVVGAGPFSMKYKSRMTAVKSQGLLSWEQTEGGFEKNSGSWELSSEPVGSGQAVHVVYTVTLRHKLMPNWLKKSLLKNSIPDLYESLKKHTL